eukprot:CAMPEP_0196766920 /NCGR_PEP_ID=MMETSP1095-20130614/32895_1 /TAXON_ID=96789 ORGANISM="Chromulina nebulosa, Strain UTEXLB2642" /NCGR_SAMPLE_ID=MMETSP1095 /ASSEMBLY_ACC=CAM_ASM_000446 /LENGTH=141 /DNA_ID=CAMNT_0042131965 /DNA_START=624 /DNA_END=1050 /DNA_ORIENTATION=-
MEYYSNFIGALVIRVNAAEQGTSPVVISILLIIINVVVFALGAITCVISTKSSVDDPIGVDDVDDDDDDEEKDEQTPDQEEKEFNKEADNNIRNQTSGDLELTIVNPMVIRSNENKRFKDDKYFRKSYNNGSDDRDSDDEY